MYVLIWGMFWLLDFDQIHNKLPTFEEDLHFTSLLVIKGDFSISDYLVFVQLIDITFFAARSFQL